METSEIAIRNLPALARSKKAISDCAQEHAPPSFEMQGISNVLRKHKLSDIRAAVLDKVMAQKKSELK